VATLRATFLRAALGYGMADLDAGALRLSAPRALTQQIAASLYDLHGPIHATALPHDDPEASPVLLPRRPGLRGPQRRRQGLDALDHGRSSGAAGHLHPPGAASRRTRFFSDEERHTITETMAKGTYGWILLATKDLWQHQHAGSFAGRWSEV